TAAWSAARRWWRRNSTPSPLPPHADTRPFSNESFPMLLFLNVIYVLLAIAMIALILMQRGAGASAGSGFGGGASATVFGSRGASSFLSKGTTWLALTAFAVGLFMAGYGTRNAPTAIGADLGGR